MEIFNATNLGFIMNGFLKTIEISILAIICSLLVGTVLGMVKQYCTGKLKVFSILASIYIELFRCTPNLLWILFIYFTVKGSDIFISVLAFTIFTSAVMAEIVRGGIMSIDKGQIEGAHSVGMSHFQTMCHVVLPQAVKNIMPSIGNEFVVNIKDSSVLSVIAITELMFIAKQAGGTYAKFVPAYVICAIIYFILTFTVTRLLRLLERKLTDSSSYTICGSQSNPDAEIHIKEAQG